MKTILIVLISAIFSLPIYASGESSHEAKLNTAKAELEQKIDNKAYKIERMENDALRLEGDRKQKMLNKIADLKGLVKSVRNKIETMDLDGNRTWRRSKANIEREIAKVESKINEYLYSL